jgi:hypothetical protein
MTDDPLEPVREALSLPDGRKVYRYSFPGAKAEDGPQVSLSGDKDVAPRVEEGE